MGPIRYHWCDSPLACHGFHGGLPDDLPQSSKVQLDNVQMDPNNVYPGLVAFNFDENPGKIYCLLLISFLLKIIYLISNAHNNQ